MIKRLAALLLLAVLGALFANLLVGYTPDPALNPTALYYAERTAQDLGAANLVTAIVISYRGLDTLGEVTVLFLAAAIVGLVLAGPGARQGSTPSADQWAGLGENNPLQETVSSRRAAPPPVGELLTTGSQLLTPMILLLGVYVFANGHLTPGGGFQGGAILASATLLLLLAEPLKRLSHRLIAGLEALSGLLFVGIALLGLVLGGGFLDNRILPLGTLGNLFSAGAIPLISALIGLKVGAEFSSILVSLSEAEES